jgi:hypothetical protein
MRSLVSIFIITLLVGACGSAPRTSSCAALLGTHGFRYMGPVIGDGELSLTQDDAGRLTARISLRDDMGSGAQLDIEGPGECEGPGLRIRFGPGDHPAAAYRVTGGTFVITRDPVAFDWFFGAWSASVVRKDSAAVETLRGFVREQPLTEAPAT